MFCISYCLQIGNISYQIITYCHSLKRGTPLLRFPRESSFKAYIIFMEQFVRTLALAFTLQRYEINPKAGIFCYGIFVSFRGNPHESLGIQESQNRVFHFQIPLIRRNFAP